MIWLWPILTIILFYFFALLQNSFFVYLSFFGAVPNFLFIIFFLFVFFSKKDSYLKTIFYATTAGIFLDIFSINKIGVSVALLIIIGLLIKKTQSLLKDQKDAHPFTYFVIIFLISFVCYYIFLQIYLYFIAKYILIDFNFKFLFEILYSLFFAIVGYFVCKKFVKLEKNDW